MAKQKLTRARSARSLPARTVAANSATPIPSGPIITGRKAGGKSRIDADAARAEIRKPAPPNDWDTLAALIIDAEECARADEMRGSGDPAEFEVIEIRYQLARAKLGAHLYKMRRERGE